MTIARREDPQVLLRIPLEIKESLDSLASKNGRSRNSEILHIIESALNSFNEKALSAGNTQGFNANPTSQI